jgi:hypothetical protein
MVDASIEGGGLREDLVKAALAALDWPDLRSHLDSSGLPPEVITDLCGHIRRYSNLIAKYPRKEFERRRSHFFEELSVYAGQRLGPGASDQVKGELRLIELIEHGYHGILDVLGKCIIGKQPAPIRVSGSVSRACHEYHDILRRRDKTLSQTKEFDVMAGVQLQDDNGNVFSPDAVIEGLSASVAMTIIMESYKNNWFVDEVVILPELLAVGDQERFQSGATQVMALFWRQWQRVEKRRRFLGGEIRVLSGDQRPSGLPEVVEKVIQYVPPEDGLAEREVYDYLANSRLKDRLLQTYMEMEVEVGLSGRSVGIDNGARLPPEDLVSAEEGHAAVSLSEILGYAIVDDSERPGGLRLLEWVRGYAVLKEIGQARAHKTGVSGDDFAIILSEAELLSTLQRCGLQRDVAARFVERVSLHKSSRDMFDCPLVRMDGSRFLLFGPAVIDVNISLAVLSNLSNRGEELSRKGKAFEQYTQEVFRRNGLDVFAFKVNRDGQQFEYDAVVVWGEYLFIFECKNRSLSGNDPAQAYYFDLEVQSQAKQVLRLANALTQFPDIIEKEVGAQHVAKKVIPCVLHSLPYSRIGQLEGVYFTDASALTRFLQQPYFWIKVPHQIGSATLLHRTALKKFWKGDKPSADDFFRQLATPLQLDLSMKHLELVQLDFGVSTSEIVVSTELSRTSMTTRSVCEAVGADADAVLQEIAEISERAAQLRKKVAESRAVDRA